MKFDRPACDRGAVKGNLDPLFTFAQRGKVVAVSCRVRAAATLLIQAPKRGRGDPTPPYSSGSCVRVQKFFERSRNS